MENIKRLRILMIWHDNGLNDVYVVETSGTLSDHYDPRRKTVRLSNEVYNGSSVASMAIAAHECGHAIQDKEGYFFLRLRSFIFPVVSLGTKFAYVVLVIGLFLETMDLIALGIALVGLGLLFQLVTLPTEINASKRAQNNLRECGYVDDIDGISKEDFEASMTAQGMDVSITSFTHTTINGLKAIKTTYKFLGNDVMQVMYVNGNFIHYVTYTKMSNTSSAVDSDLEKVAMSLKAN